MTTPSDPKDQQPNIKSQEQKGKKPKQRRRGSGEGTVFQRKDGRWVAEITLEDGRRKPLYGKTQEEAITKLHQAQYERRQGVLATGPQQKLGVHLKYWLDEVHKLKIRQTTYLRYCIAVDKHIIPAMGDISLHKLTTQRIQTFFNNKLKEKQSPSSVHTMHKVLHKALDYAVHTHLISYNPSNHISLPKQPKRKGTILTMEQARHLLITVQGTGLEILITLALATGMRLGELLALRWEDVDLEKGTVYVQHTVTYYGGIGFIEGDPKTEASERTIPISKVVCEKLRTHKVRQNEIRLKMGPKWSDHNLVCCSRTGGYLIPTNIRTAFYRILDKAELPKMRIHDLRHVAATLFQDMGVSPKVVQEILGHSNVDMTFHYTHALLSAQIEAAEKMDALFQ